MNKVEVFKNEVNSTFVQEILSNSLKDAAASFCTSLIDIYTSDTNIQECAPKLVIKEAMKAASLKLPLSKGLGFGFIIAYKGKPQFQIGYKGYIQLAIRSGLYNTINADAIYDGELTIVDKLRGTFEFTGKRKSDKIVGYFAYIELKNGFSKTLYMTKEQLLAHAKKYSKSFGFDTSPWKSNEHEMCIKTVLKNLISHYGSLSVEMVNAFEDDVEDEIQTNANAENITYTEIPSTPPPPVKEETTKEEPKKTTRKAAF